MERNKKVACLALFIVAGWFADARADRTISVAADSTVFGQPGSLVRIVVNAAESRTFAAVESESQILVYAVRPDVTGEWSLLDPGQYFCPEFAMSPGQRWRFLDDEDGATRTAEAVGLENVSVASGDFLAWRVDVSRDDQPSAVVLRMWFAGNVGLVKEVVFDGGARVARTELESYTVSGSGYFPLVVGNTWTYADLPVAADASSVGRLKARHSP